MPQVAVVAAGVAVSAGISALALGTAATIALQVAASVAFAAIATALAPDQKTPSGAAQLEELRLPDGPVPYRFVYGETRVAGSYVALHVPTSGENNGRILYACVLLNSRPSEGPFKLFFDGRQAPLDAGDPYDFDGDGATVEDPTDGRFDGHVNYWIGRGGQTKCPDRIVTESDGHFTADDAWRGRTVLWLRLDAGGWETRSQRWPQQPPNIDVEGLWSLLYDPREPSHDLSDPTTWAYSDNQALAVLDALTQNPVEAYPVSQLRLDTFETAADACDETVALKAGGTEARYRVGGVLVWGERELEDQVEPLVTAGAAELVRIGGQLAMIAGVYQAPTHTVTDILEGFRFERWGDSDGLPTQLRVTYRSPARGYEPAELKPWEIPGAQATDGGLPKVRGMPLDFVTSPTQAMRVRKIRGLQQRAEKKIDGILPPAFFDVVHGSRVTVALPAPFGGTVVDGLYKVTDPHPGLSPIGDDGGVALRIPATLREDRADIYAWDEDTDEEVIVNEVVDLSLSNVPVPGAITATFEDVNTGGSIQPQLRFSFARNSFGPAYFEWQYQRGAYTAGDLNWRPGGQIDNDEFTGWATTDVLSGVLQVASTTQPHSIRVRAREGSGSASAWVELLDVSAAFAITSPGGTAGPGAGEATFTGTAPATATFGGWRLYRAALGAGFGAASVIGGLRSAGPGTSISEAVTGLTAGDADFWLVPETITGTAGAEAGPVSLTIS